MDIDDEIEIKMEEHVQTFVKVEEDHEFIRSAFLHVDETTLPTVHQQPDKSNQINEKLPVRKCGEIFTFTEEKLILVCYLCHHLCVSLEDFGEHLKKSHISESFSYIQKENDKFKINPMPLDSLVHNKSTSDMKMNGNCINEKNQFQLPEEELQIIELKQIDPTVKTIVMEQKKYNQSQGNSKQKIHCRRCNKYFTSQSVMKKHKLVCKIISVLRNEKLCPIKKTKDGNLIASSKKASNCKVFAEPIEINKCKYCNRTFESTNLLNKHESLHEEGKRYKCGICDKSFLASKYLNSHLAKSHKVNDSFQCHFCNALLKDYSNYKVHLKRHTGEKKYKCQYCDKRFVATTEMKHHERVHTGERPFQCNECGSFFSTRSRLNSHLVKHQPEKPFKCDECVKTFYTAASLKEHKIGKHTEKKFECDMCGARLATRAYLTKHKLLHSEERQYLCSICGKGFRQQSGLFIHSKIHKEK